MDRAMPADERTRIADVLEEVRRQGGDYHRLRTRISGKKSFVDVHVLVPGTMSVHEGHDLVHRLEERIESSMPHVEVLTHLEPLEDPRSWDDPGKPMG
jgi:divalent metal cation (Fe/Co/Zn/Cd) transporter